MKCGLFLIQNRIYLLEGSHKIGAFESCEKRVTRNVYTPFISIFTGQIFLQNYKFLLRQLLIGTLDVAVAVSIHDRVIKIIH
jgi:hypothetical protein